MNAVPLMATASSKAIAFSLIMRMDYFPVLLWLSRPGAAKRRGIAVRACALYGMALVIIKLVSARKYFITESGNCNHLRQRQRGSTGAAGDAATSFKGEERWPRLARCVPGQ
ncbi:hypothetical protein [Erythrobacter sanguineus]|uniref:hypothetical protein n=1 Tax=Erythrobacter sanguineus TaxID=198312 RepID=UPI0011607B60|nr:hypothetical protein [Erythrobacter sanguineus]